MNEPSLAKTVTGRIVGDVLPIYRPPQYGSEISIGTEEYSALKIQIPGKHFNWFQKKMMKWCFGWDVKDYSDA
jgi:hypothetical protein